MDKRICYIKPGCCICDLAAVSEAFVPCEGCAEYAVVNPQEPAALETENTELKTACGLKDVALYSVIECFGKHDHLDSEAWVKRNQAQFRVVDLVNQALSLTPEAVKREAGYARVGRAVEEWINGPAQSARLQLQEASQGGYYAACVDLRGVIAQAREGEQDEAPTE